MLFRITSLLTLGMLALSAFASEDLEERHRDHGCTNLKNRTLSGDRSRIISLRRGQTSKVLTPQQTAYTGCWASVAGCPASGRSMQGYKDVKMQMTFDSRSPLGWY